MSTYPKTFLESSDDYTLTTLDLCLKVVRLHNPWLTPQEMAKKTELQGHEGRINFLVSHYDYPFQKRIRNGIAEYRLIDANQFRKRRRSRCV